MLLVFRGWQGRSGEEGKSSKSCYRAKSAAQDEITHDNERYQFRLNQPGPHF
jgi:hypothetical protein